MSLLPPLCLAALLLWVLWRLPFFDLRGCHRLFVPCVFVLKIAAGMTLWWIYSYYYQDKQWSDIYKYYHDSAIMYGALYNKPLDFIRMITGIGVDNAYFHTHYFDKMMHWYKPHPDGLYNDGRLIIRFNALVRIFAFHSIHVHTVVMAFLALCGQVAIFHAFHSGFRDKPYWLAAAVMLIPSVLFWSSGILKEGLLFCFAGFFLLAIKQLHIKRDIVLWLMVLLLCFFFLILLKIYMLLCMFPAIFLYGWCRHHRKRVWVKAGIILLAFGSVVWIQYLMVPEYNLPAVIAAKRSDFIAQANAYGAGSLYSTKTLEPTLASLARSAPQSLLNAILRPMPNPNGLLGWSAAVEVILLFLALIFSVWFKKNTRNIDQALFVALLLYVFLFLLIVGLTTPVAGALVRYRVPALPAVAMLCLLLIKSERLSLPWQGQGYLT